MSVPGAWRACKTAPVKTSFGMRLRTPGEVFIENYVKQGIIIDSTLALEYETVVFEPGKPVEKASPDCFNGSCVKISGPVLLVGSALQGVGAVSYSIELQVYGLKPLPRGKLGTQPEVRM